MGKTTYGHHAFDFDHDGRIDANEWAFINDVIFEKENNTSEGRYIYGYDKRMYALDSSGIDRNELELMDEDDRRKVLEDAGLDHDEFDDEF